MHSNCMLYSFLREADMRSLYSGVSVNGQSSLSTNVIYLHQDGTCDQLLFSEGQKICGEGGEEIVRLSHKPSGRSNKNNNTQETHKL